MDDGWADEVTVPTTERDRTKGYYSYSVRILSSARTILSQCINEAILQGKLYL